MRLGASRSGEQFAGTERVEVALFLWLLLSLLCVLTFFSVETLKCKVLNWHSQEEIAEVLL